VHLSHKFRASVLWIDAVDSGYSVGVGDHGVTNMLVQCLTAWTIVEKERCCDCIVMRVTKAVCSDWWFVNSAI